MRCVVGHGAAPPFFKRKMYRDKARVVAAFRFRRFTRAAYAVFNSLHRVVNIGRLASYIADCQLCKSTGVLVAFVLGTAPALYAQNEEEPESVELRAVQVVAPAAAQVSPEPALVVIIIIVFSKFTIFP